MDDQALLSASRFIVQNNVNEHVAGVAVIWDGEISKLTVDYFIDFPISSEEKELCELTLTELLAEFSDVKMADSRCIYLENKSSELLKLEGLVYVRQ